MSEAKRTPYKNKWARDNRGRTYDHQRRYWVRQALKEATDAGRLTIREAEELEGLLNGSEEQGQKHRG